MGNEQVVTIAVTQYGNVLKFASNELKNNKEIVVTALTACGDMAFEYEKFKMNASINLFRPFFCRGPAIYFVHDSRQKCNILFHIVVIRSFSLPF